jgi:methylenetetrahydrofolate reductase (NADPH)
LQHGSGSPTPTASSRRTCGSWHGSSDPAGFYRPDALLEGIAPILADPTANVTGFHLYLFNAVDATETWRRSKLAQLGAVA